jgi:predicted dehydrogenase
MKFSRRSFVASSSIAAASFALPRKVFAGTNADPIRIGLIGSGGRGTGAARDAIVASDNVSLVAMGDLFPDRLAKAREQFAKTATEDARFAAAYQVTPEKCFTGFDAYTQVINAGVDMVILATPPAFRSTHLTAAIAARKHVFMEKPVAVDVASALAVIQAAEQARTFGLGLVAGTQRRHDPAYVEAIKRIHDGAIGEVLAAQVYWNQGGLWNLPREPHWTDAEWQLRNWLYFTWASGDHVVEQHVHNIDVANWVFDALPISAVGFGGRQVRTQPEYGHIFDHFAVEFTYPGDRRLLSMCRQQDGTATMVGERIQGSAGTSNARSRIDGSTAWRYSGPSNLNPYVEEHRNLVASIRAGAPLNEGRRIAESTLTAILGREAAYTGQALTWDDLIASGQDIRPKELKLGDLAVPAVPMPGQTVVARTFTEGW